MSKLTSKPGEPLRFAPITADSVIFKPEQSTKGQPDDDTFGTEDPRVIYDQKSKTHVMTYTCYAGSGDYNLSMATCMSDSSVAACWQRKGRVFPGKTRTQSGSILVGKGGQPPHWLVHGCGPILLARNDGSIGENSWKQVNDSAGRPFVLIPKHKNEFDAAVETGPMPMPLSDGNLLLIFNSVCKPGTPGCMPLNVLNSSVLYAPAWSIVNGSDISQVLQRATAPLLVPFAPWESGCLGRGSRAMPRAKSSGLTRRRRALSSQRASARREQTSSRCSTAAPTALSVLWR